MPRFSSCPLKLKFRPEEVEDLTQDGLKESILERVRESYKKKEAEFGEETMRYLERMIMLQVLDGLWKDHLLAMDHLKEGIGMRAYAQQDPLRAYKAEGFQMFADLVERIKQETLTYLLRIQPARNEDVVSAFEPKEQEMTLSHGDGEAQQTTKRKGKKVGRNDPCPCGSGKKYKKCCGR